MTTYCFRCPDCDQALTGNDLELNQGAIHCSSPIVRDYRAEAVGLSGMVQLKREREVGGASAMKSLFLPDNSEFAGPGDPDGSTGMARWRETHGPKDTNKRPQWPGEVEKRVLSGYGGRGRST